MKVPSLIISAMIAGCLTVSGQSNPPKNDPKQEIKVENKKPKEKPIKQAVKPKPSPKDSLIKVPEPRICYGCGMG